MATSDEISGSLKGMPFKIKGVLAFLSFFILVLMGAVAWLVNFSLGNWGQPFPIHQTFQEHAIKMDDGHRLIIEGLDRNTYVQWACAANNQTPDAKRKCTDADPMRPESMDPRTRRYIVPRN